VERIKNLPHQVAADVPHHVTQRGNTRRFILASDTDRSVYLTLLRENIEICRVFLPGYCLMSNHIHLAAVRKDKKVRQKITTRGDRRNGTVHTYQLKCHFRLSRIVFMGRELRFLLFGIQQLTFRTADALLPSAASPGLPRSQDPRVGDA
jgi:REP element-mobilizing transposase RayT